MSTRPSDSASSIANRWRARGGSVPILDLHVQSINRWWFWTGISRARLYRRHPVADSDIDFGTASRLASIPRFVWTSLASHLIGTGTSLARGSVASAVRHEMMFCYYLGFAREEWRSDTNTAGAPDRAEQRARPIQASVLIEAPGNGPHQQSRSMRCDSGDTTLPAGGWTDGESTPATARLRSVGLGLTYIGQNISETANR